MRKVEGPCYVYIANAGDGTVLYVGVASDLKRRLREHAAGALGGGWWASAVSIDVEPYDSQSDALEVEAALIRHLRPTRNKIQGYARAAA